MQVNTSLLEQVWLWDVRHGWSTQEIARRDGFSPRRVRQGIVRARSGNPAPGDTAEPVSKRPPRLSPLFPVVGLTRSSSCPHKWKIRIGSVFCCMVCHHSGQDHHPLLQKQKGDPKPDPKLVELPDPPKPAPSETRRQKRARLFGKAKKSA